LYFIHSWGKDPVNWAEAMAGPYANEWTLAMLAERESFRQHEVHVLVPRADAAGSKIFKSRPVLKIKLNPPTADEPNGSLDKFKYRLSLLSTTLKSKFELTEKLNPSIITGVQIERCRETKWLKLHQADYVSNMLLDNDMQNCIPVDTPMDPGTARALMLLPTEVVDQLVLKKYQSLVGSLLCPWLYKTRPDLMYVTNLLARYCRSATAAHLKLAMRVLRYLKGTIDYGIVFQAGFENDGVLSTEGDADLAGDLLTSRSTSGGYVKLGEHGAVACNSSLERKISTSTGQAETYALASLVKEVVWIRHLLCELRLPQAKPTKTGTDYQGVEIQATKSVNHATAKHYRISQAYVRSKDLDGTIKVVKVSTALNHSDFLTKPLCRLLFERHRDAVMGPQQPSGSAK
jgi:hypothetical protein